MRRRLLLVLTAFGLVGGITLASAPSASAHGTSAHAFVMTGSVRIHDDETFRDTNCNRTISATDTAQLPTDPRIIVADTDNKCGGELRAEIAMSGTLDSVGRICVSGTVKLFEGTSEDTNDLDGSIPFSLSCQSSATSRQFTIRVDNDAEPQSGDYASFDVTLFNSHV